MDGWRSVGLINARLCICNDGPNAVNAAEDELWFLHTHSGFLDLSQLSRASLLKAAVAALLLLLRWMLAMVSEFLTTSMSPILFPVDKQPYGIILWGRRDIWSRCSETHIRWVPLWHRASTYLRSRPSFFHKFSISWIIWRVSMSCRRSGGDEWKFSEIISISYSLPPLCLSDF